MPSVSIIIPAWNPGRYLRPALQSIHDQTFTDWELIVVDDNSSEDLSYISREFPRVRYVRQAHGGASVARNRGILLTSAPLISFMDQDDIWLSQKLQHQVEAMNAHPEASICHCDLTVVDGEGRLRDPSPPSDVGDVVIDFDPAAAPGDPRSATHRSVAYFTKRFVVPSTVMIRRQHLAHSGLLDPFIPYSGDFDLLMKLGSCGKVLRVRRTDVHYRKHDTNFTDQYDTGRRETKALIARYRAYAAAKKDLPLAREAPKLFSRPGHMYAAQAYDVARRSLKTGHHREAVGHLLRATMFSPGYVLRSLMLFVRTRMAGT